MYAELDKLADALEGPLAQDGAASANACQALVEVFRRRFGADGADAHGRKLPAELDGSMKDATNRCAAALVRPIVETVQGMEADGPNLELIHSTWISAVEFLADAGNLQRAAAQTAEQQVHKSAALLREAVSALSKAPRRNVIRFRVAAHSAVREYALAKVRAVLAEQVAQFYLVLRGKLSDVSRELVSIRQCVDRILERIEAVQDTDLASRRGLRGRNLFLPTSDGSSREYLDQLERQLPAPTWFSLVPHLGTGELSRPGGLWEACRGADDASPRLVASLLVGAAAWLERLLPQQDVARVFLELLPNSQGDQLVRLQAVIDAAAPPANRPLGRGMTPGIAGAHEMCFVGLPGSPHGDELYDQLKEALPGPPPRRFIDPERWTICRFFASSVPQDLIPAWVLAAQPLYDAARRQKRSPRVHPPSA
jgi:hypothetical protein